MTEPATPDVFAPIKLHDRLLANGMKYAGRQGGFDLYENAEGTGGYLIPAALRDRPEEEWAIRCD